MKVPSSGAYAAGAIDILEMVYAAGVAAPDLAGHPWRASADAYVHDAPPSLTGTVTDWHRH